MIMLMMIGQLKSSNAALPVPPTACVLFLTKTEMWFAHIAYRPKKTRSGIEMVVVTHKKRYVVLKIAHTVECLTNASRHVT